MSSRRQYGRQAGQLDLLDWTPPKPVQAFVPREVRAATLEGQLSRAVSVALRDCGMAREDVAQRMAAYLGADVAKSMLDAYASQAREGHTITIVRLMALIHVTRDRRLLELLAEPFGWTTIERRFLPMIELASVHERQDELRRHADHLRRQARAGGLS